TQLYAVADLCGRAKAAATAEDYLIPSAILGCTVSGLVSRSILNEKIGPGDFHGCVYYGEMAGVDLSRWFADTMFQEMINLCKDSPPVDEQPCEDLHKAVAPPPEMYGGRDRLLVKPGIGE